ncbi:30S ribosomal protein S16 [Candidatus Karelsulcia muelleri]|uniref:Small ribosomal subunit protein bS16 n=1 Tax=Candidatus Karelsulcia muelleri TaxID=336810 RepID=A0A3A1MJZ9_9FLAO|nr:30S ribosomal protein S16 [Candidatus Karelsulcia muelleri]RIU86050.1 30S ribosomal protein S16 [Candidatus Karelsulcia muelleri]
MSIKIRLQRKGRKKKAFYTIVVSNSRSPRNGKFLEKIGFYNPNTNPYTISINVEKAVNWLIKGAQPTCTVKSFFLKEGIYYKKYLLSGVNISKSEIEQKLKAWKEKKFDYINHNI